MASNWVGSEIEASIRPVQVPLAGQPTIFRAHRFLPVVFHGLDCPENL